MIHLAPFPLTLFTFTEGAAVQSCVMPVSTKLASGLPRETGANAHPVSREVYDLTKETLRRTTRQAGRGWRWRGGDIVIDGELRCRWLDDSSIYSPVTLFQNPVPMSCAVGGALNVMCCRWPTPNVMCCRGLLKTSSRSHGLAGVGVGVGARGTMTSA